MKSFEEMLEQDLLPSSEIVETLLPFLSESRKDIIDKVLNQRTFQVAPVLENIYDLGNISAVMRSAEAFGFVNFHVIESPGAKFKEANRVARGTDKWLLTRKHKTTIECIDALRAREFKIYATHLDATTSIDEIDFSHPTAIVLGNEKDGVSKEMLDACDGSFIVPMYGFAQSFNISVAAALCFYRIHQMRGIKLGDSGKLSPKERTDLMAWYLIKSVGNAEKILERSLN